MPGLILWKDEEINKLKRDMDRLFNRMWEDFGIRLSPAIVGPTPRLNMSETEDHVVIEAELPGIDPADLDVSIADDVLTIKGRKTEEQVEGEEAGSYTSETSYSYFSRSYRLPCRVEIQDVKGTYKAGLLSIVLPKCKADPRREVKIHIR